MTNEHNTPPVAAPAPAEPFGYFRVDALGWTDCAATDEGAIALYERPAAPAVPNVMKRGYGRLIQAAADLALQQFMPSDIVDDYPSKTISAAKVAKMMTQPRDRLRLLSIEVSEGAKQMLAATPATPSQEHAVNLSCRSTQARLAAQWGYVPAPSQPAVPGVEMPLSMNQFGRLVELTREHLSDNTFVYKATSKTGDTCHFGVESAAKAWAKGGTVEAIKVREFKLHTPPPPHRSLLCRRVSLFISLREQPGLLQTLGSTLQRMFTMTPDFTHLILSAASSTPLHRSR